jgi:hypothetical protein
LKGQYARDAVHDALSLENPLREMIARSDVVAAREKTIRVIEKLHGFRLTKAAEFAEAGVAETLTYLYYFFPERHWRRIRTNNPLEPYCARSGDVRAWSGHSPTANLALNLAAARLTPALIKRVHSRGEFNCDLVENELHGYAVAAGNMGYFPTRVFVGLKCLNSQSFNSIHNERLPRKVDLLSATRVGMTPNLTARSIDGIR